MDTTFTLRRSKARALGLVSPQHSASNRPAPCYGAFLFVLVMSKISHSFSVQVACTMDIPRAIILQHLIFLQDSSESGWAKKSNESMRTTYPYLTPKAIRTALEKLEKGCYLISEIKNAFKSDRTKSYYVTPEGRAVYDLPPFAEKANAFAEKGKSDVPKRANEYR